MTAQTDQVRSVRDAREHPVVGTDAADGAEALIATGLMRDFRCTVGLLRETAEGIALAADAAGALRVEEGARVWHVGRW